MAGTRQRTSTELGTPQGLEKGERQPGTNFPAVSSVFVPASHKLLYPSLQLPEAEPCKAGSLGSIKSLNQGCLLPSPGELFTPLLPGSRFQRVFLLKRSEERQRPGMSVFLRSSLPLSHGS